MRADPGFAVCACGGPQLEAAGATMLERTERMGAVGLNAIKRSRMLRGHVRLIRRFASENRVVAHVAVDSPAANFPIGRLMQRSGVPVIHLVAPQVWAWGRWRVGKLRRMTRLVLCLLPFEEPWFRERSIPARFIGHPSINRPMDMDAIHGQLHRLPQGAPRLGIFPGSRTHEVRANIRLLVSAYSELQGRHAGVCGVIVAANPIIAGIIRRRIRVFPTGLHMITGMTEAVVAWCDLALAVSGTVTLDIARQRKPMIGVYKTGLLSWLGARVMLRTRYRLLPNIIAGREIAPEFVPHIGGPMPIVRQATRYLLDSKHAAVQSQELDRVCRRFSNHDPPREAAIAILEVIARGG